MSRTRSAGFRSRSRSTNSRCATTSGVAYIVSIKAACSASKSKIVTPWLTPVWAHLIPVWNRASRHRRAGLIGAVGDDAGSLGPDRLVQFDDIRGLDSGAGCGLLLADVVRDLDASWYVSAMPPPGPGHLALTASVTATRGDDVAPLRTLARRMRSHTRVRQAPMIRGDSPTK
jgi:hypothetical protein